MLKIIFFITFCNLFLFADNSQKSIIWQKLTHNQNNENQIVSNEFYLSSNKNATPKEELEVIKELLKSNNGYETACTFPVRYEFIKSNFNDIPVYDLQSCKELNSYLDSFPKDKLSIVFTSEYTNNPSSAFGHIMLLFSKDNTPLEIGDVVHFAAKTSTDDNFLKYSYKGMTGQYNGYLNFLQQRILKIGFSSSYKQYDGDYFYQNDIYTSYKYKDYIFTLKYTNDNSESENKYF